MRWSPSSSRSAPAPTRSRCRCFRRTTRTDGRPAWTPRRRAGRYRDRSGHCRRWRSGPGHRRAALTTDDGRSLAVLPLTNLSADSGQDYFSDGLSEEILGAVSRIPGLRVAAHTSSFALKGTRLPVGEIGQKLGVRHVLEGSVQREGDNVRVRARLVDANSGYQVWDAKYDKQASNLFALEDEVAAAIAAAITTHLGVAATDAPRAAGGTLNAAAHDAYLRGRQALRQRSGAVDLMQAIAQFQAALVLDSTYARAWAGLGTAQVLLPEYGGATVPQATPEARRAITHALALDSTSAEAWAALGYLQKSYDWDWKAAEASYDRALALDPNAAGTWQWYGELLETVGRHEDAGKAFQKSVALDPVSPVAQMALGSHLVDRSTIARLVARHSRSRSSCSRASGPRWCS